MDFFKLKDLPKEQLQQVFVTEAFQTEERQYMKPLDPEELNVLKDELAQTAIKRAMLEDELANIVEDYKQRIKPLKEKFGETLDAIKHGSVEAVGTVYLMKDWDNQMIYYIGEDGTVINSRRMKPEERQTQFRINSENDHRAAM